MKVITPAAPPRVNDPDLEQPEHGRRAPDLCGWFISPRAPCVLYTEPFLPSNIGTEPQRGPPSPPACVPAHLGMERSTARQPSPPSWRTLSGQGIRSLGAKESPKARAAENLRKPAPSRLQGSREKRKRRLHWERWQFYACSAGSVFQRALTEPPRAHFSRHGSPVPKKERIYISLVFVTLPCGFWQCWLCLPLWISVLPYIGPDQRYGNSQGPVDLPLTTPGRT